MGMPLGNVQLSQVEVQNENNEQMKKKVSTLSENHFVSR
jgi:hypothetical protein